MKIKHKSNWEVIDAFPHWEKLNGRYGYIVPVIDRILFFHSYHNSIEYEDVTSQFEIIEL